MAGKLGKKKTAPVDHEVEQDDLTEAAEDVKDEAVAQLAAEAAETADVEEDEDDEILDESEDGDEDDDDEEVEESNVESTNAFVTNAQRLKQQAARSQQVAEASGRRKIIGATGTTGTVNKKNTHFTKRDPGSRSGGRVNTKRTMGVKTVRPGATVSVSESRGSDRSLLRENAALAQENRTLRERNAKLAEALNTHRTADHAQRLLESSDIPARLHPGYLRTMIGMSERDMNAFISDKLTEIDAITEAAHSRIEGAGSSIRESYHGGAAHGGGLGDVFAGIPTKTR